MEPATEVDKNDEVQATTAESQSEMNAAIEPKKVI